MRADPDSTPADLPRTRLLAGVALALTAALYLAVSLARHRAFLTSGFDLGIFEQEVRSYATGRLPTSTLKGPDFALLGDHFSPIVAVLAPVYALFPAAATLLVAQALLLSAGVVPLARWARAVHGRTVAVVVAAGYSLSWGLAETIGFDFHEVAFAVPLLAFSLTALAHARHRTAVLWALPLVLVKEDLGLTLAVIGVLVIVRGGRRWGAAAVAVGVAAAAIATAVVIPAFSATGGNPYAPRLAAEGWWAAATHLLSPDTKLVTLVLLLAPTAFVALRSPLLWVALPTLLWRFVAATPGYWGTHYHYSAVLVPVVFAAFVDGLTRCRAQTVRLAVVASAVVTAVLVPSRPLGDVASPHLWSSTPRTRALSAALELVPPDVTVSASNWVAPHLTGRDDVSLFGYTPLAQSRAHWVVVDLHEPLQFPIGPDRQRSEIADAISSGYRVEFRRDDVVVLRRD